MRKRLLTLSSLLFFLVGLPLFAVVAAQENKIRSIQIAVELHPDGSATIREKRETEMYEDTELYIRLDHLQDSKLLNFQVEGFQETPDWKIDASFEEKAYQYGVLKTDNGYELVWGISDYGPQEYNLSYSLSNIVRELEDGQALFWNFDTFLSHPTDRLTLEVEAPFPLEEQELDFYGFGFEGPLELTDGRLKWTGYGLTDANDATLLLQFPEETFTTQAKVAMTLAEQREMATAGSSYNEEEPMPTWAKILLGALGAGGVGAAASAAAYGVKVRSLRKEKNHFYPNDYMHLNKDRASQQPPRLEGDIGDYAYFLARVVPNGGGFANYFFAYLLIWSFEEQLAIETREEERFLGSLKTTARLQIKDYEEKAQSNAPSFEESVDLFDRGAATLEEVVWSMLQETADRAGVVEGERVKEWSKANAERLSDLIQLLDEVSKDWLVQKGYLTESKEKVWRSSIAIEALTAKGEKTVNEIIQFSHFIQKMNEQSLKDFKNWQELIIWSALFGQAEETVKYLEEFEPGTWAYLEETYPYVYGHYYGWAYFYTSSTSGMGAAGSSSAGGGGFSSGGGGMGAGGGGGGGSR